MDPPCSLRPTPPPIEIEWNGMKIQSPVLRCQVDFKSWKLQVKSSHEVLCKSTSKSFYCQVKSQTQTQVTPRSSFKYFNSLNYDDNQYDDASHIPRRPDILDDDQDVYVLSVWFHYSEWLSKRLFSDLAG